MNRKTTLTTRKLVFTALLAALTAAGSALRITLPLDIAGTTSFHLGNILCALSGLLLGPWLGGLAAGLGSMLYDLTNPLFISESPITFIMKFVYGMAAGLVCRKGNLTYGKAMAGTVAGAVSYALLYLAKSYFYSGLLLQGLTPAVALVTVAGKLPATVFNAAVAVIGAPVLALAVEKALHRSGLKNFS